MTTRRNNIVAYIVDLEGGYSKRKTDKGGETYAGIVRKYHPNWSGWQIVDQKPRRQGEIIDSLKSSVYEFYYQNYYSKMPFDRLTDKLLAAHLFSFGVTSYFDDVDRILEEITGIKTKGYVLTNDQIAVLNANPKAAALVAEKVKAYYRSLNQPVNLKGWLARVDKITAKFIA